MQAVLVPVGAEWYAVPMASVREVVPAPTATPVPTAPAAVLGVWNLRGEIVPLFDTAALLGLPPAPPAARPMAVVVDTARGPAGLAATGTPRPAALGDRVGDGDGPVLALHAADDVVAGLLDVERLLGAVREG